MAETEQPTTAAINAAPLPNFPAGKKQAAQFLASGYTRTKRMFEICSCIAWTSIMIFMVYRVVVATKYLDPVEALLILLISIVTSIAAADFISGILHWTADTWGDLTVPFFATFIRSFREHHIDPVAMTRHDLIETNADSLLASLPFLLVFVKAVPLPGDAALEGVGWGLDRFCYSYWCFMSVLALFVGTSNQIHKWAHTYRPAPWIRALQRMHLILPPWNHAIHHKPPHDTHYCITTGWLNPTLDRIGFWRAAERVISNWTGAIPRRDDFSWMKTASAYSSVPGAFELPCRPSEKVE